MPLKPRTLLPLPSILLFAVIMTTLPLPAQPGGGGTALLCGLRGPDSIRFIDDHYEPDPFRLEVSLHNPGGTVVRDIAVYMLSSRRFTLLSSATIFVDSLAPGETRTLAGEETFLLHALAADRSETDTLSVLVDAAGSQSECFLPVHVEKERRPRLEMICEAPAALDFDETLNAYVPDPFPVRTILRNTGDAPAVGCHIDFTGPPRLRPQDGIASRELGVLAPGGEFEYVWLMTPQRRDVGQDETLRFEAQGRGGLDVRTVNAVCDSKVFIPTARARQYRCVVEIDSVSYDAFSGRYNPDPLMLRATVTNIGQGIGSGMTMHVSLDEGLLLAPGQKADDTLHEPLQPGGTAGPFVKSIRPLRSATGDSLTVVVHFRDAFGNGTVCEQTIWIPPAGAPMLSLGCATDRDSITVDARTGGYEQTEIRFDAVIENVGGAPVYNVSLFAFPEPDGTLLIDARDAEIPLTTIFSPGDGPRQVSWSVRTQPSNVDRTVRLRVLGIARNASGQHLPLVHCEIPVFVPAVGQARLSCALSSDVTDGASDWTVDFDTLRSDYEGTPSRYGAYSVFRIGVRVTNTGDAIASPVNAVLLLPPPLQFEEGESETKPVQPAEIPINGSAEASWLVRPFPVPRDSLLNVEVLVSGAQAQPVRCTMQLRLAEALDVVYLSIPGNMTGVEEAMLDVPVSISPTPGLEPRAYQFMLRFDPELLRFVELRTSGTLTESGWRNPQATLYRERGFMLPGLLCVSDSTRFTPQRREEETLLVRLRFEVLDRNASPGDPAYIVRSPFSFLRYPSVMADGTLLRPSVTPHDASGQRRLVPSFRDGEATLSGECVLPLSASTRLFPNRPNPFNPVTAIPFHLAGACEYRLTLLDRFGRRVRTIAAGWGEAGRHEVLLDAGDLPSGVYYCVLEAGSVRRDLRLLLVK